MGVENLRLSWKMFYEVLLTKELELKPQRFTLNIQEDLKEQLFSEVQGKCTGRYGYQVAVKEIENIGKGRIQESGYAAFTVEYRAIVFRPVKNETLEAVVCVVNNVGFFCNAGPVRIFISQHQMPDDYGYDESNCWISRNTQISIKKSDQVRIRIIGVATEPSKITAVGTIKDNYLGLIPSDETDMDDY